MKNSVLNKLALHIRHRLDASRLNAMTTTKRGQKWYARFSRIGWSIVHGLLIWSVSIPAFIRRGRHGHAWLEHRTYAGIFGGYKGYRRARRKFLIGLSMVTLGASTWNFTAIRYDMIATLSPMGQIFEYNQFHDGIDWEVAVWGAGKRLRTQNMVDDRNLSVQGIAATWQQFTPDGYEIMYWTVLTDEPVQLTDNTYEDTKPKTDGRFIVWQQKYEGAWRILLWDLQSDDLAQEPIVLSTYPATDPQISRGRVAWQEWVDDNWEVMTFDPQNWVRRVTYSDAHDIVPAILNGDIYWEGQDVQEGDSEIYKYDTNGSSIQRITTDSTDNERPFVANDQLHWFERVDESLSEQVHYDEGDSEEERGRTILPRLTTDLVEDIPATGETTNPESADAVPEQQPIEVVPEIIDGGSAGSDGEGDNTDAPVDGDEAIIPEAEEVIREEEEEEDGGDGDSDVGAGDGDPDGELVDDPDTGGEDADDEDNQGEDIPTDDDGDSTTSVEETEEEELDGEESSDEDVTEEQGDEQESPDASSDEIHSEEDSSTVDGDASSDTSDTDEAADTETTDSSSEEPQDAPVTTEEETTDTSTEEPSSPEPVQEEDTSSDAIDA